MNKHGGYYGDQHLEDRSININPLGTPPKLLDVLKKEISHLSPYPTPDAIGGRKALSRRLQLPVERVLLGNGAISLLYLYARAKKFSRVLLVDPSFNEYHRAFRLAGSEVHRYLLKKPFIPSQEAILTQAREKEVDLVLLCNPCNPTGVFMNKKELRVLYQGLHREGRELFLDESFLDFVGEASLDPAPGLFQLRSLTKFYALAGLRLGYCLGDEKTIEEMINNMEPWNVNHLAEQVVLHLDELTSFEETSVNVIQQERKKIFQALDKLGVWHSSSRANFILIHIEQENFFEDMLEKGYYLRRCEDFAGLSGSDYRFALGLPEKNEKFIKALKEVLCFI